jgi:hypothetical protein
MISSSAQRRIRLPGTTDRVNQLEYVSLDDATKGSSYIGTSSGIRNPKGQNNTFVGSQSGTSLTQCSNSVLLGTSSGQYADRIDHIVAVGSSSVENAINSSKIVAIGSYAAQNLREGNEFVSIGYNSGTGTQATQSVSIGTYSSHIASNIHGSCIIGHRSALNTESVVRSVSLGSGAIENAGQIHDTVFIGARSGLNISGVSNVVAIGSSVMDNVICSGSSFNTVVGAHAAESMCGNANTLMGYEVAKDVKGENLTIIGSRTAQSLTGNNAVIIGADLCNEVHLVSNATIIGQNILPETETPDEIVEYKDSVFIGSNLRIKTDERNNSLIIGVGSKRYVEANDTSVTLSGNVKNAVFSNNFTVTSDNARFTRNVITQDLYVHDGVRTDDITCRETARFEKNVYIGTTNLTSFIQTNASTQTLFVRSDGSDTNSGTTFATAFQTIAKACSVAQPGQSIHVESGVYVENTPIVVPQDVSIIGNDLRTTIIDPQNKYVDVFHVNPGVYISNLRILNLHRPAVVVSFPCSIVDTVINNGGIQDVTLLYSCTGYATPPEIVVEPPESGNDRAIVTCTISEGTIDGIQIQHPGSGYTRRPYISIPPPQKLFIIKSPYIQNCTFITQGLYRNDGTLLLNKDIIYPIDLTLEDIDLEGGGGGTRVDGRMCMPESPLKSMLAATFTVITHGGIAHHNTNLGFSQLVSCYTHFAHIGYFVTSGGQISLSNSVCDFGEYGVRAEGYYNHPTTESTVLVSDTSSITVVLTQGRKPDVGACVYVSNVWYYITGSLQIDIDTYRLTFYPSTPSVAVDDQLNVYIPSKLYTSSLLFEWSGSGISYNSLPELGGISDESKQIINVAPGRCYHTSSNELGDLKVGSSFFINQLTGSVSLTGDFEASSITRLGPFVKDGVSQGVAIEEISDLITLQNSYGSVTNSAVSTSLAVKKYVDQRSIPIGGTTSQVLQKISNDDWDHEWQTLQPDDVGLSNVLNEKQIPDSAYNQPNGVPQLDAEGKLDKSLIGLSNVLNEKQIPDSAYNQPNGVPQLNEQGKITLTSPNGTVFELHVENDGTLVASELIT